MPKKKRTAKQLAADKLRSEKMKGRLSNETVSQAPSNDDLQKQIEELKSLLADKPTPVNNQATLTQDGVKGTVDRYSMELGLYPDPRPRLRDEARLKRFAFGDNYELEWDVTSSRYQTIDGIWRREPQFRLELIGKVYDKDTGEPTDQRYTITKGIFFEDPEAAMTVAQQNGINFDEYSDQELFLNEMRYIRMRDWLLEAFFPPKNDENRSNKTEQVIGNKLVDVWTVTSETTERIPFDKLSNKL